MSNNQRTFLIAAKHWAAIIWRDVLAVWIAGRDRRTPVIARSLSLAVAAYALSPIDLIPDFIPVIGYLDDLIIVPAGIMLVIRLIPPTLMSEYRLTATAKSSRPVSRIAAVFIVVIWIVCLIFLFKAVSVHSSN